MGALRQGLRVRRGDRVPYRSENLPARLEEESDDLREQLGITDGALVPLSYEGLLEEPA